MNEAGYKNAWIELKAWLEDQRDQSSKLVSADNRNNTMYASIEMSVFGYIHHRMQRAEQE